MTSLVAETMGTTGGPTAQYRYEWLQMTVCLYVLHVCVFICKIMCMCVRIFYLFAQTCCDYRRNCTITWKKVDLFACRLFIYLFLTFLLEYRNFVNPLRRLSTPLFVCLQCSFLNLFSSLCLSFRWHFTAFALLLSDDFSLHFICTLLKVLWQSLAYSNRIAYIYTFMHCL